MKKLALMAVLAIAGVGSAIAAEHHVTINTSCGYAVDMVYDTDIHTVGDMVNDALILDAALCGN